MSRFARAALLSAHAFVAITALAGGAALIAGSVNPAWASVLVPPADYLEGSPFASFVVPGVLLIVLVAGMQSLAFVAVITRSSWAFSASAAAGFSCLIWIFVQMIYIPFSFLQALYFVLGLIELMLTMVLLGILVPAPRLHESAHVVGPTTPRTGERA